MIVKNSFDRRALVILCITPPAFLIADCSILLGLRYFTDAKVFLLATIAFIPIGFIGWKIHSFFTLEVAKKFNNVSEIAKRIFYTLMVNILISLCLQSFIFFSFGLTNFLGVTLQYEKLFLMLLLGMFIDMISAGINEGMFLNEQWQESTHETEFYKSENVKTQLHSLKQQVNPHFLFNSLNSLSSLITEDPQRAEKFLDEMAKVYRYMLRTNENELVCLSTELNFITSYFYLLKTRYGNGVEMNITPEAATKNLTIPPLNIQLLVENAVKHNIISKDKPLHIEIGIYENTWVYVKNNLQKKIIKVDSSKIGLQNINEKYRLLNMPDLIIEETNTEFLVLLALIESKTLQ